MRKLAGSIALSLALGGVAYASPRTLPPPPPPPEAAVGVDEVLRDPDRYAGRSVTVRGFLIWEHEGDAVWAGEDAYRRYDEARRLWVERPRLSDRDVDRTSGKSVFVTGTFDPAYSGYILGRGGGLVNVTELRTDPADTAAPRPGPTHPHFMFLIALGCIAAVMFALLAQGVLNRRATRL